MTPFSCPHCGQKYKVADSRLGTKSVCQRCGNLFAIPDNRLVDLADIEESATPTAGFMGRLRSALANADEEARQREQALTEKLGHPPLHRMLQLTFLAGPIDLPPNSPLFLHIADEELRLFKVVKFSGQCDQVLAVRLDNVKNVVVDVAERMTIMRAGAGFLLAGVLGAALAGWGFKKKSRLLRLDLEENGQVSSLVLGGASDAAANKIMAARRCLA